MWLLMYRARLSPPKSPVTVNHTYTIDYSSYYSIRSVKIVKQKLTIGSPLIANTKSLFDAESTNINLDSLAIDNYSSVNSP